ncbi:MAG: polysaccharide biosynthesis protein [Bacteroidales bacterium]|nr:polysaccharide biosynthesis protein [Bacteroidales bacterium]
MSKLYNYLKKVSGNRYVNIYIILVADITMSTVASVLALLSSHFFYPIESFPSIAYFLWALVGMIGELILFYFIGTYRATIRHSTLRDIAALFLASVGKLLFLLPFGYLVPNYPVQSFRMPFMAFIDGALTFILLIILRVTMIAVYDFMMSRLEDKEKRMSVLVVSKKVGNGAAMIERLQDSPQYRVVGMGFSSMPEYQTVPQTIKSVPSYYVGSEKKLMEVAVKLEVKGVIFVGRDTARSEKDGLVSYAKHIGLSTFIAPEIEDATEAFVSNSVRAIKIEDLLGREEIKISTDKITEYLAGKTVMVTGAAGSIGSELVRQIATFGVERIILFDNAETPMHNLRLELEDRFKNLQFVPVIGDVRQSSRLDFAFSRYKPQVVFHAAAYKHVPLMEENPCEAVLVNCFGSKNVADKCLEYGVEKMVMISTDKAVNPTSVMGCTKRVAEIYVQRLGLEIEAGHLEGRTKFVTTRFGNVLGSNGSVIPRFREQIERGGPVTVTHPEINRFFMTIPEACRLVMEAAILPSENKICVFDMGEAVKIVTLAERMIELAGYRPYSEIPIVFTGLRPGEKLYEEVLSDKENTIPTDHEKIRIAKTRENYSWEDILKAMETMRTLAWDVNIPSLIDELKNFVPEYTGQVK